MVRDLSLSWLKRRQARLRRAGRTAKNHSLEKADSSPAYRRQAPLPDFTELRTSQERPRPPSSFFRSNFGGQPGGGASPPACAGR